MNGEQAQRHIDEATDRVFEQGIENATQADLMFFGFGYLAHIIKETRAPESKGSGKKGFLGIGAAVGAVVTWFGENLSLFFGS